MATCVIADGTPPDAPDMVALDERNFARGDRFDRRLWRSILSGRVGRGTFLTLVARHQGVVVGAIVGEFRPPAGRLTVWSIAVDEPFRGDGLAQRLMADLVSRTPPACTFVGLDARRDNERARRFYARLGFRELAVIPRGYADGTDAIRYETPLDDLRRALDNTGLRGSGANPAHEPRSGG